MVDMSVFLAEKDGVKLATRRTFWRMATPEMWALPWDAIINAMTVAGWTREEKRMARITRRRVKQSIYSREEKEKAYQQAIADKDMNVFLVVDKDGVKLATKPDFWRAATEAMWAVPTKEIWKFMEKNGWTPAERKAARSARYYQTPEGKAHVAAHRSSPEGKAYHAAYCQKTELKARIAAYHNSPEAKALRAARHAKRMATDSEYATRHNSRNHLRHIYKAAKKSGLYTPAQLANLDRRTHELLGCSSKELMEHFEKQFKQGMTHFNRCKYNRNDHMTNPTWQADHSFPTAIMFKNKHILGLEEFVIGYKNYIPRDAKFNQIKQDHIILECISPDCPGYPFADGLVGVERIFKTIDAFLDFLPRKYNRSDFPLL
jgi:hypothetical protein